jgi:hypothetical protein
MMVPLLPSLLAGCNYDLLHITDDIAAVSRTIQRLDSNLEENKGAPKPAKPKL